MGEAPTQELLDSFGDWTGGYNESGGFDGVSEYDKDGNYVGAKPDDTGTSEQTSEDSSQENTDESSNDSSDDENSDYESETDEYSEEWSDDGDQEYTDEEDYE